MAEKERFYHSDETLVSLGRQETHNFVSAVLDTVGALIVVLDRQGRIVRFNRACQQLSGYSFQEAQGQPIWDLLLLPEERAPVQAVFEQLRTGHFPNKFENYWVARDGSRHLISWSNTTLLDPEGMVAYVIGTGIDITQRNEAEEAYQALVDHSLQGLAIFQEVNQEFRLVFANPGLFRIGGYSKSELMSMEPDQLQALIHPEDRARVWERAHAYLAGEPVSPHLEFRFVCKAGLVRWIEGYANRIKYQGQAAIQVAFIDISGRKWAEMALRESEALYRALIETSPDAITLTDLQGRVLLCNEQAARLHGFESIAEMKGQNAFDFIAPEDRPRAVANAQETLESGSTRNVEYILLKQDGRRFYAELSASLLKDESGQPKGFIGVVRDITERKQAEQALRQSEARLDAIISTATDAIITLAADQQIILFNAAAEKMFGYSAAEVIGRPLELLLPERFREKHIQHIDHFGRTGVTARSMGQPGELYGRRADGREFPIEVMISQVEVAGRKFYTAIARDITRRKQAEEIRAYLAAIVGSSDDAIVGETLEGQVVSWNRGAEQLYGYRAEEMIGHSIRRIFPPEWHDELPRLLARLRQGESVKNYETQRITKDGRRLIIALTLSPIKDAAGNLVGVSAIARDITARKQTQLELAQLLEAVSEQREQLLALTGQLAEAQEVERKALSRELHDQVGQKLTALNLNLNALRARLAKTSPPPEPLMAVLEQSLELVEETTERVQNVMADLRPPMLDDHGLLAALQWYGAEVAARTNFEVAVQGQEPEPRLAAPVEHALFRITQEALNNIVKHAQAAQVALTLTEDNGIVRLVIADNGRGFDPSRPNPGERPGWGLLTMMERAEAVGGQFQIRSRPGEGTQVIVEVDR